MIPWLERMARRPTTEAVFPMLSRSPSFPLLRLAAGATLAVLLTTARTSFAADDCPPGSWFCGDQQQAAGQAQPTAEEPAPAAQPTATPAAAGTPPPPVIVYQAPPRSEPPPPYVYTPAEPPLLRNWAIGANVQIPLFFGGSNSSGMGGVGGLLRIRPRGGVFAIQGEVGSYFGRDYNGDNRAEFAMAGNVMLFVMPKKRTSLYFLGGLGFSAAHVGRNIYRTAYEGDGYRYSGQPSSSDFGYFGAQTGIGLEVGLGRRVALDFQLRAFMRQRIDSSPEPEFVRGNGQTTNASAGGMLSTGLTFYF